MSIKQRVFNKESWSAYLGSLRYALHCCVRPFDGFWDLTHEKRGSVGAANTIVILVLLTNLLKLGFTSFIFQPVNWNEVNLLLEIMTFLLPFVVYCVANWCLTTLFEGKGTLKDIYMGTAYAMTPYVLIQLPLIVLSNVVTEEEGAFYIYFGMVWTFDHGICHDDPRLPFGKSVCITRFHRSRYVGYRIPAGSLL